MDREDLDTIVEELRETNERLEFSKYVLDAYKDAALIISFAVCALLSLILWRVW